MYGEEKIVSLCFHILTTLIRAALDSCPEASVFVCVCVCACVRACVRACSACVCVCVCEGVSVYV